MYISRWRWPRSWLHLCKSHLSPFLPTHLVLKVGGEKVMLLYGSAYVNLISYRFTKILEFRGLENATTSRRNGRALKKDFYKIMGEYGVSLFGYDMNEIEYDLKNVIH